MAAPSGATPALGLRFPTQDDDVDASRDIQALALDVEALIQGWVGEIRMFGFAAPPARWLPCDGSTRSRTAYPELFTALGTTWNTGGEAGTDFRLPDLRGRAPVGPGTASGGGVEASPPNRALAAKWGVNAVALSSPAQLPPHSHTISDPGHAHAHIVNGSGANNYASRGMDYLNGLNTGPQWPPGVTGITINSTGSSSPHENAPPSVAVPMFIYAGRA